MALNEQTDMVFGDQPIKTDPVSGNEVPPGALPSEVRDDIPARLSEGEYVVPADVLQYYGIKFFEDLRGKAKMELASMEENGRMGGEPVDEPSMEGMDDLPFSDEELNTYDDGQDAPVREFDEGGPVTEMASLNPRTFIKTYINEAGNKLYIRFVNGVAIPPVPPGYTEEGAIVDADPVDPVADDEQRRLERERNEDPEKDQSIWDGTKPPIRMTTGELAMAMAIHSGGTKVNLSFLPGTILAKALGNLLGGSSSMSEILQKEVNRRLEDTTKLSSKEVKALTNMSNLDITKIETWRETLSKPLSEGGAATSLNKISDIFKGRNNPTRTGTGIQTYEGDYNTFLDPSTTTATSKFYKNKLDADAARIEITKDYRGRTPNVVAERFASIRAGEGNNRSDEEKEKYIEKIKNTISKKNIKEARIELDDREDSIYIDGVKKEPVNTKETTAKEIGQKVGKGYTGGAGFNKGGLASRRKGKNK